MSDLAPDPSAGLDFKGVIPQGFRGKFLLNSSWRDFEKVDEGQKISSQLWVRMAEYRNYIKYVGRKLNTLMWLRMAGYQKYIKYVGQKLNTLMWLRMEGYVFISSFVSLSKHAGRKLSTLMWLRMAGEFMSIYLFV